MIAEVALVIGLVLLGLGAMAWIVHWLVKNDEDAIYDEMDPLPRQPTSDYIDDLMEAREENIRRAANPQSDLIEAGMPLTPAMQQKVRDELRVQRQAQLPEQS